MIDTNVARILVAAVQFAPETLQVQKNLRKALELTFEAAAKGARVIVLPELCLSGLSLQSENEAALCAQTQDGAHTQAFASVARKFKCAIVFGYVEYSERKFYNSAAIVDERGLIGNTQKHNLWGPDNLWATPSVASFPVTLTQGIRLGALVCRDAMNKYREASPRYEPSHRFYRKGTLDAVALLTNWGSGYGYPDTAWVDLRDMTGANVIVSNRVGEDRDLSFKGGSAVLSRDGKIHTNGSTFTDVAVVGGWLC